MTGNSVVELRQYTLYRGKRDTLISIFEQNLIEPQETLGAHVLGSFRDLDDPDRFVWLRGFQDMPARQKALEAFYNGPVWEAHKSEANVTMVDSDNVLLLRPLAPGMGNPKEGTGDLRGGFYGATIHYLGNVNPTHFAEFFDSAVLPFLSAAGVRPFARLVTEEQPNNFARLPIREQDRVFIWLARWPSLNDYETFLSDSENWSGWRDSASESVLPALVRKPERLRLMPTEHSRMQ